VNITGERTGSVLRQESQYLAPELRGNRFGKLIIVSDMIRVMEEKLTAKKHLPSTRKRKYALTLCRCGVIAWKNLDNIRRITAGCRICDKPRRAPKWLTARTGAAKDRCENPNNPSYADYGGRGIRFCFKGPTDMALWLMEHFDCTDRRMQIDRINNNGNYEPGNLRMTTPSINQTNTRHQLKIKMLRFRQKHPEIRYADTTLCHLISQGFSDAEIVERFNKPSCKPKGVYGTFSTPDPDIVSQLMVY
jgi:hypothetical protein